MNKRKKILVAPLDWGLGHATRCIPIIRHLIQANCEIIIAASGNSKKLLEDYFPKVKHLFLEGYQVNYSKSNIQLNFISQVPKIFAAIKKENSWLQETIKKYNVNAIVSDNRYGLSSDKIPSVLITHQLNIQGPKIAQKKLNSIVDRYINQFSQCWVPDYRGKNNLAGILSHRETVSNNIKYLGPLSRFSRLDSSSILPEYDFLGIVSGPENQRTLFEEILMETFLLTTKKCLIICGQPLDNFREQRDNVTRISHLQTEEFIQTIYSSKTVICRAGYSTIMDLVSLGKGAVLVPTPGQTEQEYLSNYLDGKFGFSRLKQEEIKTKLVNQRQSISSDVDLSFNNMNIVQSFLASI